MKLCEYIEKISDEPLSDFQKKFLEAMEEKLKSGYKISIPPRMGRTLSISMICALNDWKERYANGGNLSE